MLVLLGTKEGFKISEKWILERTGLLHASYIKARQALVNRGWLTHEESKGITVNINTIYNRGNTILQNDETKNSCSNTILPQGSNTILPHSSNMTLPHCSNTIIPITNKEKINKEIKETNKEEFVF
jgi:hypothetical protein